LSGATVAASDTEFGGANVVRRHRGLGRCRMPPPSAGMTWP